jgi:hypothetical protein
LRSYNPLKIGNPYCTTWENPKWGSVFARKKDCGLRNKNGELKTSRFDPLKTKRNIYIYQIWKDLPAKQTVISEDGDVKQSV